MLKRGLTYFDEYQKGARGYFAFDQGAIWRVESILPAAPLIFILRKINLKTMEDFQPNSHVSVTGTGNIVTTGSDNQVHINQMSVQNNLDYLIEQLAKAKVSTEDVNEIIGIVQQERPSEKGELPPKTQNWLNNMVKKAAAGGWEVVVHTAGHLLAGLIKGYYGLPG